MDNNISDNNIKEFSNLLEKVLDTVKNQSNIINDLIEVNKILEETIEIKDQTMDKQLQIIQILELKLKDFGFELGDPLSF